MNEYIEARKEGFIENYKPVRHREEPKFRKHALKNVHKYNIRTPFKFCNDEKKAEPQLEGDNDKEFQDFFNEQKLVIARAKEGPRDKTLISKFNLNITGTRIDSLGEWLNDNIILFYMNRTFERSKAEADSEPTVYAMTTFFILRSSKMEKMLTRSAGVWQLSIWKIK